MIDWRSYLERFNAARKSKGGSARNVMVLMTGTLVSQVLPILFFPILSRIYTPADYGILGLFMSISLLLMAIANLQLNLAILIPKEDADALKVFVAGSYLVINTSVFLFVIVAIFGGILSELLNSPDLDQWLYLLPVTIFFSGINIQFSSWFNRFGKFKVISASRIVTSVVTIALSFGLSFFITGPAGLILGYVAGNFVAFILLLISFRRGWKISVISWSEFTGILKKHQNFASYTMLTEVISNFSQQLPLYIFSIFSGVTSVGLFSRSRQILGLPITYFGSSVSEVYKQKAGDAFRNKPETLRPLFIKTISTLAFVSLIPFLLIVFLSPELFAFFFGENWREAGVYTQCLALMYFAKFIVSPVTFNFYLVDKQKLDFILHILVIAMTSLALYVGLQLFNSETYALLLFSIAYAVIYLIYGVLSYQFTKLDSR